jgi:hypothetical protein
MHQFIMIIMLTAMPVMVPAQGQQIDATGHTFVVTAGNVACTYRYTLLGNELKYMSREWTEKKPAVTTHTTQSFKLERGKLVSAREIIREAYSSADSSFWSCDYVFKDGKMIDLVSTGHGKSEDDAWDPEKEVLENFRKVSAQVMKDIRRK